MLTPVFTTQFRKDFKLCQKRGFKLDKLAIVMKMLESEVQLPQSYREHTLKGEYNNLLECHIEVDWLMIYDIDQNAKEIYFIRTGTHSDLF